MKRTISLALAVVTLAVAASCGSDEDEDEAREATTALTDTEGAAETAEDLLEEGEDILEGALTLDLREQNNSGITGTVAFNPTSENTVEVEVELDGNFAGPHPAHIHPGSCADLDPAPKWPLENVVGGKSKTTIEVELAELTAEEYAVNVHESVENAAVYVACADVRNQ